MTQRSFSSLGSFDRSESGEHWLDLDTADTSVIAGDGELDVALVTPAGVPGVLDSPVLSAIGFSALTDDEHGVVQIGAAVGAVEDASRIELEDKSVSLNGDDQRLLLEGGGHAIGIVGRGPLVSRGVEASTLLAVLVAGRLGAVARDVRVVSLKDGLVALEILDGLVLPASVAAVVGSRARDELLLGERLELAVLDLVGTLDTTGGRE